MANHEQRVRAGTETLSGSKTVCLQATSIALKHDLMAWMSDLAQQDRAMLDNLVAGLKGEVKGLGINRPNFQHVDPTAPNTWLKKLYDAFSEGHFQKLNGAYNNIETAMAHLLVSALVNATSLFAPPALCLFCYGRVRYEVET